MWRLFNQTSTHSYTYNTTKNVQRDDMSRVRCLYDHGPATLRVVALVWHISLCSGCIKTLRPVQKPWHIVGQRMFDVDGIKLVWRKGQRGYVALTEAKVGSVQPKGLKRLEGVWVSGHVVERRKVGVLISRIPVCHFRRRLYLHF